MLNAKLVKKKTIDYSYCCTDNSLLRKYFNGYILIFKRILPYKIPSNLITLVAFLITLVMLCVVEGQFFNDFWSPLFCAICLHFYLVGDHLDGWQAKRTNTSSPLGEFVDHFCDMYVSVIAIYTCYKVINDVNFIILYLMVWLSYCAFAATIVDQRERGVLHFCSVGTLEAVVVLIIFLISFSVESLQVFWLSELFTNVPYYLGFILLIASGYLFTITEAIKRMNFFPPQFFIASILSFLLLNVLCFSHLPSLTCGLIVLTLFWIDYIANVLISHLLSKAHPYPDKVSILSILLITICFFGNFPHLIVGIYLFMMFLILKMIYNVSFTIYRFREYWVWSN